ncbi:MAG TPA: sugar phosphate isomerase/epimerase family protein [Pirellulales bacterium]|nr:sugar phosphate isomerase/epimerase family protein [Pirellulales bacterium]
MQPAVSRRGFLGAAVAGGLAGWAARPNFARADDAADRFGGFPLGIQSYTLRAYALDTTLQIIHEDLGLHFVEIATTHLPVDAKEEQVQKVLAQAKSLGIKIAGHGVNGFGGDHDANRRVFEFAKRIGARTISADPSPEAFESLDKLVVEYDIRIAIHNHGPGARYDKVTDVLTAIKGHHPSIGACADLGHYIRAGEDPVRVIHLLAGRLYGLHLKDYDAPKKDARGVILGKGLLDLAGVFGALKKVDFPADGCLSVEYEEKQNDPVDDVKACLAACEEGAQKAMRSKA